MKKKKCREKKNKLVYMVKMSSLTIDYVSKIKNKYYQHIYPTQ